MSESSPHNPTRDQSDPERVRAVFSRVAGVMIWPIICSAADFNLLIVE